MPASGDTHRHQGFHARILYRPTAALASALGEAVQSGSTDSSGSTRPALRVLTSTWEGGWEVAGAQDSVAVTFDMGLGGALYADEVGGRLCLGIELLPA